MPSAEGRLPEAEGDCELVDEDEDDEGDGEGEKLLEARCTGLAMGRP